MLPLVCALTNIKQSCFNLMFVSAQTECVNNCILVHINKFKIQNFIFEYTQQSKYFIKLFNQNYLIEG